MKTITTFLCAALLFIASNRTVQAQSPSTFTAINLATDDNPLGYWEFLPGAYYDNPATEYPVLIFMHGNGERGNGSTEMNRVLKHGPPKILNNSGHALHDYFDDNDVIVISPQTSNTSWTDLRAFLDYILDKYRVDRRCVYLTGLSGGAGGIHRFMNNDRDAREVTACVAVAIVGGLATATGGEVGADVPYWVSTAWGDGFGGKNTANTNGRAIASARLGVTSVSPLNNYPGNNGDADYSASFDATNGWTWVSGRTPGDGASPRITLLQGSSHDSWTRTYDNVNVYNWLLDQIKPTATVTSPQPGQTFRQGLPITFSASAVDNDGAAIPSGSFSWVSHIDGLLGTGDNLTLGNLSPGCHTITCLPVDAEFRAGFLQFEIEVEYVSGAYPDAFTVRVDFGHSNGAVVDPGWNNFNAIFPGEQITESAIDTNDVAVGVRLDVIKRFNGTYSNGVSASDLYPAVAQSDSMSVSWLHNPAILQISGLNPGQPYDFKLFASRDIGATADISCIYRLNGVEQTLNAAANTNQTVDFNEVWPDSTGCVFLEVDRDPTAPNWVSALLGVMEISTDGIAPDADIDGMSDSWELQQFGDLLQAPDGDFDGDGVENIIEFATGTSPTDPSDLAEVSPSDEAVGNDRYPTLTYNLNRDAASLVSVSVEQTLDLSGIWSDANAVFVSTEAIPGENVDAITYRSTVPYSTESIQFLRANITEN
ncbi:MAG: hypothetical protein AAFX93_13320 [Verrucomicrobiota bacterium]